MAVRIITDSASDYLPGEREDVEVLPLGVTFGDDTYLDGVDLSHERFYELLAQADELPHTNAVTPYDFGLAFDEAAKAGDEVVVLTIGDKLSATNQNARIAAEGRDQTIRVVNTRNVCVGERALVDLALRLAAEGLDANAIADELEVRRSYVRVIALFDTLEYLVKGGRLPAAVGTFGSLLSIKPVAGMVDGEVTVLGKARGPRNGENLLNKLADKNGGVDFSRPVVLGYPGNDVTPMTRYVENSSEYWRGHLDGIVPHTMGGTIGTHVGPGCIAIGFFSNEA